MRTNAIRQQELCGYVVGPNDTEHANRERGREWARASQCNAKIIAYIRNITGQHNTHAFIPNIVQYAFAFVWLRIGMMHGYIVCTIALAWSALPCRKVCPSPPLTNAQTLSYTHTHTHTCAQFNRICSCGPYMCWWYLIRRKDNVYKNIQAAL